MDQLRLGIDLDGVVADFNTGWMTRYNEEQGTNLTSDLMTHWDLIPQLTHFDHMGQFWRWASDFDGDTLFRSLNTHPGAIDSLWTLARAGHQIVIVTTKPGWAVADTYAWIADQRLPTREVHITGRKWEVECDVYLDDSAAILSSYIEHRPGATTCRFVRPWNHHVPGAIDITTWDGFIDVVRKVGAQSERSGTPTDGDQG